jgi:hypothetical protein
MKNYRSNWQVTVGLFALIMVIIGGMVGALPGTSNAVDPGINQPGAAGNVGRDPGINQPGAAGNVGAGGGVDPGINQPGAAGNVGRDPGINQPGPAGNRRGIGR